MQSRQGEGESDLLTRGGESEPKCSKTLRGEDEEEEVETTAHTVHSGLKVRVNVCE